MTGVGLVLCKHHQSRIGVDNNLFAAASAVAAAALVPEDSSMAAGISRRRWYPVDTVAVNTVAADTVAADSVVVEGWQDWIMVGR